MHYCNFECFVKSVMILDLNSIALEAVDNTWFKFENRSIVIFLCQRFSFPTFRFLFKIISLTMKYIHMCTHACMYIHTYI